MYSTESLKKQLTSGIDFWILYNNETAIGYTSLEELNNKTFKLHKLYVSLDQQTKGAGAFMIDELIKYVAEKNGVRIELQVNRTNKAVEFYKKQGFYIVREADFEIGNGFFMNDYIMQKDVTFAAN
jgi:ribosomal protein S18 acetylase RimI-like enzyme